LLSYNLSYISFLMNCHLLFRGCVFTYAWMVLSLSMLFVFHHETNIIHEWIMIIALANINLFCFWIVQTLHHYIYTLSMSLFAIIDCCINRSIHINSWFGKLSISNYFLRKSRRYNILIRFISYVYQIRSIIVIC
jgi:hypothetical protein